MGVSDESAVLVEVERPGVTLVRLADEAHGNAFTPQLLADLSEALERVGRDADCHAVVLAGGEEVFSSGAPLSLLESLVEGAAPPADILLPRLVLDVPVPVIAACAGSAVGGGFALALAADIVVLAEESRYALNFIDLGFTPGMGTTRLAEQALPPAIARELLYTAEARRGSAFRGQVNAVVPRRDVLPRAIDLAARIADKPRPVLCHLKRVLSLPRRRAFEEALAFESLMHELTFPAAAARVRERYAGGTSQPHAPVPPQPRRADHEP